MNPAGQDELCWTKIPQYSANHVPDWGRNCSICAEAALVATFMAYNIRTRSKAKGNILFTQNCVKI